MQMFFRQRLNKMMNSEVLFLRRAFVVMLRSVPVEDRCEVSKLVFVGMQSFLYCLHGALHLMPRSLSSDEVTYASLDLLVLHIAVSDLFTLIASKRLYIS